MSRHLHFYQRDSRGAEILLRAGENVEGQGVSVQMLGERLARFVVFRQPIFGSGRA